MERYDAPFEIKDERFQVTYLIAGDEATARATAEDICVEQSVEFPVELVPAGFIRDMILGRIESFELVEPGTHKAVISYHVDTASEELTQLLNVIFGNISIKPNIKVEKFDLPESLLKHFRGPRFGTEGLRKMLGAESRPLLATALKPMGLSAEILADYAYRFALGGMDIIKDDHGLSNQRFANFEDRVRLCSEAVAKANKITGKNCLYFPNITGPFDQIMERAHTAKRLGAGGLLISPALTGFDTMRAIADHDEIGLPIMSHPAFIGSYVNGMNGISHYALFGQMMRLSGADTCVYPNYGGRFAFSKEECKSIVAGAQVEMGSVKTILPAPGGGMTMERIPDMLETYQQDVIYLIGGGIFKQGPDLTENVRFFKNLLA